MGALRHDDVGSNVSDDQRLGMGLMHVSFLLAVGRSSGVEIPKVIGGLFELPISPLLFM